MSLTENLTKQLRRDEGEVLHAYQDSLGYWTIGVGRLIDGKKGGGITTDESALLLSNDITKRMAMVRNAIPWIGQLDEARQGVLLNMAFQMGIGGLMGFTNTLAKIKAGSYIAAADGMLQSRWAGQTPERAKRLAMQIRTGEWQ